MAKKNLKFVLKESPGLTHQGMRLDVALAELSGRSRTEIRKLIVAGAVYVNRKRVRVASRLVQGGSVIEFWAEEGVRLEPLRKKEHFQINDDSVIFEDEALIAINKPSGLPTQPTIDEARDNAFALTKRFLQERANRRGDKSEVYLGLHHRLDKDTSGVLLFTKDKAINGPIGDLFKQHEMKKEYLAVVRGKLRQDRVQNFLGKLPKVRKGPQQFGAVRTGGDFADTAFECLATHENGLQVSSVIRAIPKTGRTHQIRVHLSEMGNPILGDSLYGSTEGIVPKGPSNVSQEGKSSPVHRVTRLMLHAHRLSFVHPKTQVELVIEAEIPREFKVYGIE